MNNKIFICLLLSLTVLLSRSKESFDYSDSKWPKPISIEIIGEPLPYKQPNAQESYSNKKYTDSPIADSMGFLGLSRASRVLLVTFYTL